MSSNLDDLMHSLSFNRAYEKYTIEHKESTNQLLQNLQNQLKESYLTGYNDGHQNGVEDGLMDAKFKMLVKLAVHTDLEDQVILKVLEKEDNENYIDALKQLRKKQQEQK
ncbi:hypothetical protein [Oceanobacillus chungangensis]|uniref:Uncharacterized protein n=1 Tax=Oceanobacillus chungangensis TaxID=1229152 RepID=A0A3D8PRM7_9BACI|nr:hypothetical protein [Oceanobacillus chungangensis]RDW18786.1 hypothetical protein CWR45_09330 [Oceanobacillus chungangensis]